MKWRFPLSLLSLLLLEGCAALNPWSYGPTSSEEFWTPPKYLFEIAKTPSSVQTTELPDNQSILSLGELLNIAFINNTETKQTWAEARTAAARYAESQSAFMPALAGSYSYSRIRQPSFFSSNSSGSDIVDGEKADDVFITLFSQWGPQFSLTYTLFDFGQRRATSLAAKEALYYADYTHNRAVETVMQTITNDYYSYLYQEMLLIAYRANVETAQTTLEAAQLEIENGVKDVSDVLQAKTQLLQNEISFIGQKQQVQNSFVTLVNDMGVPSNMTFGVVPMPDTIPEKAHFPDTDSLIQIALENRPDYLASRSALRAKEQGLIVAKRQLLPSFDYNLNFGKTYYHQGINDKYDYASTVSVSMPLFSGFFFRNKVKEAEAQVKEAEARLDQIELSVIKDITSYRYNLEIAYETMKYSKAYLEAAEEQYRVSLAQYKVGTNTILDVISAQSALADARAKQASSIQEWYSTLANLIYAIGIPSKKPLTQEAS